MLFHIALVSMIREVNLANLASVTAAIQKQVSRDFGPMWNVEATVDAFGKLEDVPIGYWHVLLQDELQNGAAGLHKRDDSKQPFALVALTPNWPVFVGRHPFYRQTGESISQKTIAVMPRVANYCPRRWWTVFVIRERFFPSLSQRRTALRTLGISAIPYLQRVTQNCTVLQAKIFRP